VPGGGDGRRRGWLRRLFVHLRGGRIVL
jgi:hypothetical protein